MKILFVHNALRSFVRVDRDILSTEHDVDELDLSSPARILSLVRRLRSADLVYVWFASLHSLAPALLARAMRKPLVVVVGGYDTARMPEIGYGHMAHPLKRHVVRAICASATTLLVNSRAAKADVERNVATRTPINVVYHGFPVGPSDVASPRETLVLSVGNISRESLSRKGHAAFVKAATLVPGAQFVLVGQSTDGTREDILRTAPPNLSLPGFVSDDELQRLYARASVYVQVSMHEGFGCSLAEAMAAGCIPVISGYGALPEVTGGHGHQVDDPDPRHVADAVRAALQERDPDRRSISEYVLTTFPLERRQEALLALVDTLGTGGAAAQRPQVARRPSAPDS